ncbi:unnamed protein product [Penicillium nalgiovense]|uniref:Uncharacterized protein n=1 Tax=Penicillium nalgiovense TaxID=60175 RepID=A0A1V6YG68_PENNA|nr:hypothetical protein PENNAL_c0022G11445 [Penicillium nalgiovense]CAG7965744.1 unnamed protein product [Penicillium nalgiovense]CAG7971362.1 unnamed protein product [Penicillium nalgiovense]CAG8023245.1 unnamed protein product [Penicillium nalgiovense]CAG8038224.1 unnamed protein product [Penicillium nalgiovense]
MGGPYMPRTASVGGRPTIPLDVPICTVFLALFIAGAACHMTLFRRNLARGHKFIPSAATFGFCISRCIANIIRIAWACHPTNIRLAIAASIFVAAGVLLLFILNLLYAQRMFRAVYPVLGWSRPVSWAFKALYILVGVTIVMVITCVIQSSYTLNSNTLRIDRDILLYGQTYFSIISFLPLPLVLLVILSPDRKRIQEVGSGSWVGKVFIVVLVSCLLCLGASFRAGTSWMTPRPVTDPAWYHSKACFYIFNFTIDLLVVVIFFVGRVDQRFWVPNGSSKVRHYSRDEGSEEKAQAAQNGSSLPAHDEKDIESGSSSMFHKG